jgi:hypothetical protein
MSPTPSLQTSCSVGCVFVGLGDLPVTTHPTTSVCPVPTLYRQTPSPISKHPFSTSLRSVFTVTQPSYVLLPHVFPHTLLDNLRVHLSSSKPPLFRQHCRFSSLLVTSSINTLLTHLPPFTPTHSPPPIHHRQSEFGLKLSHQFGDDALIFLGTRGREYSQESPNISSDRPSVWWSSR